MPLTGSALIASLLPQAPLQPGVYMMKNSNDQIIYVGKAKILRKRLANYARIDEFPGYYRQKVQAMVAKINGLEWVITSNEKEALILESNLIKLHRPRYNVDLRDDKTYPFFRLSVRDEFPRLHLVRRPDRKDGARYWGPLENVSAARRTLDLLHKSFPLRRCSNRQMLNRSRPCLDYEMKRCLAPCANPALGEAYRRLVSQTEAFFAGQGGRVVKELEASMISAAAREEFELAAGLRDRMLALQRTLENQQADTPEGDMDAWGLYQDSTSLRLGIARMRSGQMISSQIQDLSRAALDDAQALAQGLLTFYHDNNPPPPLLLLSQMPEDMGLISEYLAVLRQGGVELRIPQRGDKRKFLDIALKNAALAGMNDFGENPEKVLENLSRRLGLADLNRMECMDISHLGGAFTVASVVCFVAGRPLKSEYRRYQLKDIPPGDDYSAINRAFTRRLNSNRPWPDLMVVDGGKGQLAMAEAALKNFQENIDKNSVSANRLKIIALAKDREEKESDKVYVPGRKNPLNFPLRDRGLALLMALRDEAHRVAIGYQRLLKKKSLTRSILDEIAGLGPKNKKKLNAAFPSFTDLKASGAEEISRRAGISQALAREIADFLKKGMS
ncbi:MAG: excinuclease ABC subunit UvrC [Desulfarculales bacterium]|jgi:excinuclease ABC subunit C|nr:excinuclease ABC subunit UvrC [Desulfarculales bacterium]